MKASERYSGNHAMIQEAFEAGARWALKSHSAERNKETRRLKRSLLKANHTIETTKKYKVKVYAEGKLATLKTALKAIERMG